jgi:hypothetical protein
LLIFLTIGFYVSRLESRQWSLGRDLDPRPPPYQGDAPPG